MVLDLLQRRDQTVAQVDELLVALEGLGVALVADWRHLEAADIGSLHNRKPFFQNCGAVVMSVCSTDTKLAPRYTHSCWETLQR